MVEQPHDVATTCGAFDPTTGVGAKAALNPPSSPQTAFAHDAGEAQDVAVNAAGESVMPSAEDALMRPDISADDLVGSDSLESDLADSQRESDIEVPDDPSDDEAQPAPFAAGFPGVRAKKPEADYPVAVARDFEERFAHRLRWAHAVNSRRRLRSALSTPVHFIEADVSVGPLTAEASSASAAATARPKGTAAERRHRRRARRAQMAERMPPAEGVAPSTCVRSASGDPVIMAHYPTELSSDLSLEGLLDAVIRHNEHVARNEEAEAGAHVAEAAAAASAEGGPAATQTANVREGNQGRSDDHERFVGFLEAGPASKALVSPFSAPHADSSESCEVPSAERAMGGLPVCEEAAGFARELDKELDSQARSNNSMLGGCVGSRHRGRKLEMSFTRKGVKLDFKRKEAVEPALRYLRDTGAAKKLGGHLWLNADVFAGPGNLLTPLDAKEFAQLCAEALPEAVLSLSWGSSIISTTRMYTDEMVESMLKLVMSPIIPRLFTDSSEESPAATSAAVQEEPVGYATEAASAAAATDARVDGAVYLTPAAVCRHITFAVAAEYALDSAAGMRRLLDVVPGSSLTIFCGVGSLGITPSTVQALIVTYGKGRIFLDLKLSKSWRSDSCSIQ